MTSLGLQKDVPLGWGGAGVEYLLVPPACSQKEGKAAQRGPWQLIPRPPWVRWLCRNVKMESCLPVIFFLALFTCQAARTVDPSTDLSRNLGSSVDLPMGLPKGADFMTITLHSVTKRKGVALWQAGKSVQVLNTYYSKRVTIVEDTHAFRINSLSLGDTGTYNILMQSSGSPTDIELKTYTVFVFNVTATPAQLSNGSCSLDYHCEVGWRGAKYSWKNAISGNTVSQDNFLHLVLHPTDRKDNYTCMAQISSNRGSLDVTPYKHCLPKSGAAGYLRPALPRCSCLLSAALVVLVAVLL